MSTATPAPARGELLWSPAPDAFERTRMGRFCTWLAETGRSTPRSYDELWAWSVADLDGFWRAVAEFFELRIDGAISFLADCTMPATWLPGAALSYPEHALRHPGTEGPAVIGLSQTRDRVELSFDDLRDQVARCRAGLVRLGVRSGDTVAGYLPHIPEAIVAFLATASLGAVWVSCPPEFGTRAVVDRLSQVEPVVLLAVDGLRYGDKAIDRRDEVAAIRAALPSVREVVSIPYLGDGLPEGLPWATLLREKGPLEFARVPFDHPLYVLFSSGTTGLPKAIVHGHGGILLEHAKALGLHNDVGPGDRFLWFSTTGWMMWNYAVSALLHGAAVVCFDGNLGWPDLDTLWRAAAEEHVTYLGTSASFLMTCRATGLRPGTTHDLSTVRGLGSTGSPLPAEGYEYVYEHVSPTVLLGSASGGTDICSAFVGASPLSPVRAGEIPVRMLGVDVAALGESGSSLLGVPGELVVTTPMPSMPVGLACDRDGRRLRAAYYDQNPGVWTHGDWICLYDDGASVISGRSDATLNRGGVRLGTSDFYSVAEDVVGVTDSLVVHLEDPAGGAGRLILFVVGPQPEDEERVRSEIRRRLRSELSPRHVPDDLVVLSALPRTLSGKKLETPVKRILQGAAVDSVVSRDSLVDPDALDAIARWRTLEGEDA